MEDVNLYSEEESDLSEDSEFDYEDTIIDFNNMGVYQVIPEKPELSVIESDGMSELSSKNALNLVMEPKNKEEVLAYLLETHTVNKNKNLRTEYDKALKRAVGKMNKNKDLATIFSRDRQEMELEIQQGGTNIDYKIKEYMELRREKLALIAEQVKEEFSKNYTFTPKINATGKKRNIEQFLSDQSNFVKKVADKVLEKQFNQELKESKEVKDKPVINANSKKIAKERDEGPVHERLYNQRNTFKIDLSDSAVKSVLE